MTYLLGVVLNVISSFYDQFLIVVVIITGIGDYSQEYSTTELHCHCFLFWNRVSLICSGWPCTCYLPASVYRVPGLTDTLHWGWHIQLLIDFIFIL